MYHGISSNYCCRVEIDGLIIFLIEFHTFIKLHLIRPFKFISSFVPLYHKYLWSGLAEPASSRIDILLFRDLIHSAHPDTQLLCVIFSCLYLLIPLFEELDMILALWILLLYLFIAFSVRVHIFLSLVSEHYLRVGLVFPAHHGQLVIYWYYGDVNFVLKKFTKLAVVSVGMYFSFTCFYNQFYLCFSDLLMTAWNVSDLLSQW